MYARIGENFEQTETIDEETISAFAHLVGDLNPLHHDRLAAAASRFGGIIASGPHCASILLSQAANYFSRKHIDGWTGVLLEVPGPREARRCFAVSLGSHRRGVERKAWRGYRFPCGIC